MALQTDYQTPFGIIPDAYCRICSVVFDEDTGAGIEVRVKVYLSREDRDKGYQPLAFDAIALPSAMAIADSPEGRSVIAIAYNAIKALEPKFGNAVDV